MAWKQEKDNLLTIYLETYLRYSQGTKCYFFSNYNNILLCIITILTSKIGKATSTSLINCNSSGFNDFLWKLKLHKKSAILE